MGLATLPKVGAGQALGPTKANDPNRPFNKPGQQSSSDEWNAAAVGLQDVCAEVGLGDGTTPGSLVARANAMDSLGATFLTRADFTFDPDLASDVYEVPVGGGSYVLDSSGWEPGDVYAAIFKLPSGADRSLVSVQSGATGAKPGVAVVLFPDADAGDAIDGSFFAYMPRAPFVYDHARYVVAWLDGMWRTVLSSSATASLHAGELGGAEVIPDQTCTPGFIAQLDESGAMRWVVDPLAAQLTETKRLEALRTFPSKGNARKLVWREEFLSASPIGANLVSQASNGGSTSAVAPSVNTRAGVFKMSRGTSTNGRAGVGTSSAAIRLGGGRWRFRADVRIPVLSNVTDRFLVHAGFSDSFSSASPTDGVYLRVVDSGNGGLWEFVAVTNGVNSVIDTGVAPVAGAWQSLEIEVNEDGSQAIASVDGSVPVTLSTNIPTAAGRETGVVAANLVGQVGTTDVSAEIDMVEWSFEPTGGL